LKKFENFFCFQIEKQISLVKTLIFAAKRALLAAINALSAVLIVLFAWFFTH
jgi:hypothetical protein